MLLLIATTAALALPLSACRQPGRPVIASTPAQLAGAPSEIYDRALPALRERISAGTQVVRIDDFASIKLRFSVRAHNGSVRLVEIDLHPNGSGGTTVSARSTRFSFLPVFARDDHDLAVEEEVIQVLEHFMTK